jgi:hypothetical protein
MWTESALAIVKPRKLAVFIRTCPHDAEIPRDCTFLPIHVHFSKINFLLIIHLFFADYL